MTARRAPGGAVAVPGRVAVAMSGGVDSAVAALLLRRAGADVIGFFLRNGVQGGGAAARSCCSASDAADARDVADRLGIPFYAIDVARDFAGIIDRFVQAYRDGRTPNPCVECNVEVKFGHLLALARSIGAERVATGHYARVRRVEDAAGARFVLSRARDRAKDQSYVLASLRQEQLARAVFPLGELTKAEARELARAAGLRVADKPESQEICFVPSGDYRDLLRERAPDAFAPGEIVSTDGAVVGRHEGVASFTIGQRKGIGHAAGTPRHVVRIDAAERKVVVGERARARARAFDVGAPNWISVAEPPPGTERLGSARIRHRHEPAAARVTVRARGTAEIRFDEPEFAVTPGQVAVLYAGDDVLMAGTIDTVYTEES